MVWSWGWEEIEGMVYGVEEERGIERVVGVVGWMGSEECFELWEGLVKEWGVGKKGKNKGVVMVVVREEGCIELYRG